MSSSESLGSEKFFNIPRKSQHSPIWCFKNNSGRNHPLHHQASDSQWKQPCWQVARSPSCTPTSSVACWFSSLFPLLSSFSSLSPEEQTRDPACPTELGRNTMMKCFVAGAKFSVHCNEGICDRNNSFSNTAPACTWKLSGCSWISVLFPVIQTSNTSSCCRAHKV